jgi:hypothetical protein
VSGGNSGGFLNKNNNQDFVSQPRPSLPIQTPAFGTESSREGKIGNLLGIVGFTPVWVMEPTLPDPDGDLSQDFENTR